MRVRFVIIDQAGEIVLGGSCPDGKVPDPDPGLRAVLYEGARPAGLWRIDVARLCDDPAAVHAWSDIAIAVAATPPDLIAEQHRALNVIDARYSALIAAEIGPLGTLHALKRAQAEAGAGALLDGDRDAILARAAEQDQRLAELDRERRDMKARLRAAASSAEIDEILNERKTS